MTENAPPPTPSDPELARGVEDLLALLRREVRGLEVLDQDFVITAGDVERRAEWIGVDRAGRLVLIVLSEGSDDEVLVTTLAALTAASEVRVAAARRWPEARIQPDAEPLVVLVARNISPRVVGALAFLQSGAVLALELRTLETAHGGAHYLARREIVSRGESATNPDDVLLAWPEPARERARDLASRVARIDPEIECHAHSGALRWIWRDEDVAELDCPDGRLHAEASGSREVLQAGDEAGAEAWLERALLAHCARRRGAGSPGGRPLALLERSSGPLLTPEEVAAFRD